MAIKLYSEGKLTISECAQMAEKSVGEMMELLTDRGIKSKITIEDFEEGLSNALDLFGN
jgi:predicted HTH domain antitoxin